MTALRDTGLETPSGLQTPSRLDDIDTTEPIKELAFESKDYHREDPGQTSSAEVSLGGFSNSELGQAVTPSNRSHQIEDNGINQAEDRREGIEHRLQGTSPSESDHSQNGNLSDVEMTSPESPSLEPAASERQEGCSLQQQAEAQIQEDTTTTDTTSLKASILSFDAVKKS